MKEVHWDFSNAGEGGTKLLLIMQVSRKCSSKTHHVCINQQQQQQRRIKENVRACCLKRKHSISAGYRYIKDE
jgi:hypothetical protein